MPKPTIHASSPTVTWPPRRLGNAVVLALLLVLGLVPSQTACSQRRAPRPNAEEALPPSAHSEDPELPKRRSGGTDTEEVVSTVLLVVLGLAAAAGMAYLSIVVIPDAIN
ncbi:MAG: hypothetical protein IPK07_03860 [Deltaproteobacteria bacterium]|nr:hypothetical protein [Deltaproteobacteria bacterium]